MPHAREHVEIDDRLLHRRCHALGCGCRCHGIVLTSQDEDRAGDIVQVFGRHRNLTIGQYLAVASVGQQHRTASRQRPRARPGLGNPAIQPPDSDSGHAFTDLFERLVVEAVERGADGDHIAAALDQATQAAADVLAERLRARAPRMLQEHRDFRRGFEQCLQQRWGPALDLYESVRVCCLEAGEDFAKRRSQQADEPDPKLAALTLLHARASLVASEVQSLLRSGHAADAQARWRTLHELAVIAFVLGDHDRDLSERFMRHHQVERHKDALHYQQYCQALGCLPFSDEQMAEIQEQRDEVVARYGTPYKTDWGWAVAMTGRATKAC